MNKIFKKCFILFLPIILSSCSYGGSNILSYSDFVNFYKQHKFDEVKNNPLTASGKMYIISSSKDSNINEYKLDGAALSSWKGEKKEGSSLQAALTLDGTKLNSSLDRSLGHKEVIDEDDPEISSISDSTIYSLRRTKEIDGEITFKDNKTYTIKDVVDTVPDGQETTRFYTKSFDKKTASIISGGNRIEEESFEHVNRIDDFDSAFPSSGKITYSYKYVLTDIFINNDVKTEVITTKKAGNNLSPEQTIETITYSYVENDSSWKKESEDISEKVSFDFDLELMVKEVNYENFGNEWENSDITLEVIDKINLLYVGNLVTFENDYLCLGASSTPNDIEIIKEGLVYQYRYKKSDNEVIQYSFLDDGKTCYLSSIDVLSLYGDNIEITSTISFTY